MNHQINKPIRTYEKRKLKEVKIPLPKVIIPTLKNIDNKKLNKVEKKEIDEYSLYDDPFETTFDRLLKNMRLPPKPSKTCNNTVLLSSTDNTSEISNHKSLHELHSYNLKPVPKQKTKYKKVKKDDSHKKYKLRIRRNSSKIISDIVNIDSLSLNPETAASRTKKYNHTKRKIPNKKHFVKKRKGDNNLLSKTSFNNIRIKECVVKLDRLCISKWNKKVNVEYNLPKEVNELPNQYRTTENSDNNLEHNEANVKHCFIKLEKLETDSYTKSHSFGKKYENVVSSTPNSRPIKPSAYLIPLSPIPTRCFKKENNHVLYADNSSVDKDNEVSLKYNQINDNSRNRSNIEKYKSVEKFKLLLSYSTNVSNFSNYNLHQSENADKENINSLITLNCNDNDNCNQEGSLIEKDSMENNPRSETKQNDVLSYEHANLNIKEKKPHLRFSLDVNRSRSLFDDTNKSIQTRLYSSIKENDKVYPNSVKLIRKSILNMSTDRKVRIDKIQEELPERLISNTIITSDASFDDMKIKLKTEKLNDKNKDGIDTNDIDVDNDEKFNILPCYVNLKQLQDPIRVTKRRKYAKWNLDLDNISEECNNRNVLKKEQMEETNKSHYILDQKLSLENIAIVSTNEPIALKNPIYLKPGKSWARSLSILNSRQTEFNLDKLSVGKGKRWRHSVQDILNMQKQGIIQSCIKNTNSNNDLQIANEIINESGHELANNKSRTCESTNFGRISRRISVRVVPIHKSVKSIEDAPFLEVYGIVPVKNQRFTLLNNPRKSSTCNVQNDDINDQIIEQHVVSTAKEVILQRCSQKDYIPFSVYFSDLYLEHCRKIGEGVYGEVFLYEEKNKKSVIKIIPIEGNEYVNGEPQKKFHEILSEIVIAMELHNLRFNTKYNTNGFVEVKNIKCIKGKYPKKLVELWNIYDEEKRSDNDCPSMFHDDQLYIILELGHGGQDLEAFVFDTAEEAHILFIQAALALAVAEKAVEFEHRDLHWGNILISPTNESSIHYKLGQKNIELISKGVKVSIIDFTLSRVTYQGCSIFNDLTSDPTLFTAQGDYQFEIYRLMKNKLMNNWQKFEPYTNILWLHYTLDKMITAVRYRKRNLKIHKNGITKLKELKNEILTYSSAFDFVTNCDKIVNLLYIDTKSKVTV